jgi:molecular chaperone GrpE
MNDDQAVADADAGAEADEPPAEAVADDMENQLRRALADLDNLRKRFEREAARERSNERARFALEWLPVVDNLERALEHADADTGSLVEGIRAVRDQALGVLARYGFPRFDDLGQLFNPQRDEAMGQVDSDAEPGTVVAALRPGYGTSEALLRPAGVVVARGAPDG